MTHLSSSKKCVLRVTLMPPSLLSCRYSKGFPPQRDSVIFPLTIINHFYLGKKTTIEILQIHTTFLLLFSSITLPRSGRWELLRKRKKKKIFCSPPKKRYYYINILLSTRVFSFVTATSIYFYFIFSFLRSDKEIGSYNYKSSVAQSCPSTVPQLKSTTQNRQRSPSPTACVSVCA